MHKLLLITGTLLFFCSLNGQTNTYFSFPDSNAKWTEFATFGSSNYPNQYAILGDTVINGQSYHKVYHKYFTSSDTTISVNDATLIGAIREDSLKRVFCFPLNYYFFCDTTAEYKLYDFSKHNPGDTIQFYTTNPDCYAYPYLTIDFTDSVLIDNSYRRRIHFIEFNETWIEGVGSTRSLFSCITPYLTCSCGWHLVCFRENDTTKYINPLYNDCYSTNPVIASTQKIPDLNEAINIFPNPASHNVSVLINYIYRNLTATILTLDGKEVLQVKNIRTKILNLDLNLPAGLYYAQFTTDGNIISTHKIIISD